MALDIPFFRQDTIYTCGPAALQMALAFLGHFKSEKELAAEASADPMEGTLRKDLILAARKEGFYCYEKAEAHLFDIRDFITRGLPVLVNYIEPSHEDGHFAVVAGFDASGVVLNDPWNGAGFTLHEADFLSRWRGEEEKPDQWMLVFSTEPFNRGVEYTPL